MFTLECNENSDTNARTQVQLPSLPEIDNEEEEDGDTQQQQQDSSPAKATMDELERVKQKLASLYEKKSTSVSRQLFSNNRHRRRNRSSSRTEEVKTLKAGQTCFSRPLYDLSDF